MDGHAYFEDFEVKERWEKSYREAEQWRLSRLAKAQKDEHQGRRFASFTALWNSFVSWAERTASSPRSDLGDARSSRTEPREPQEQCC